MIMNTTFAPWLMLLSRSLLFLFFQALMALVIAAAGNQSAWGESVRWWTLWFSFANIASLYLLVRLYKAEGKKFWEILRFSSKTWKTDLPWLLGFTIIGLPIAAAPREPLATLIFGDPLVATKMLFQPLPAWAFVLSFAFPLTIWFSELPTYFSFCMPRLEGQLKNGWLAWFLASLALAAQHIFLPFIPNGGYLLWRFGMFLPFALVSGLALKFRPSLLPYLLIGHGLLDVSTVMVYPMLYR